MSSKPIQWFGTNNPNTLQNVIFMAKAMNMISRLCGNMVPPLTELCTHFIKFNDENAFENNFLQKQNAKICLKNYYNFSTKFKSVLKIIKKFR